MERRDLIKDEIERLGKVLGKIVADLLNLKAEGNTSEGIEQAREAMQEELDFDIPLLVEMPEGAFLSQISEKENLSLQGMEQLGDILFEMGEGSKRTGDEKEALLYLAKAFAIYEYITKTSATFSLEREEKVNRIETLMK